MIDKPIRTLSWNLGIDPETKDRAAFLKLSSLERWNYVMEIVLATYPGGPEAVTCKKRRIEWE